MSAKFLRYGDPSDRGPSGEFGAVFLVKDAETGLETGCTVRCGVAHAHSRECMIQALKAPSVVTGQRDTGQKDGEGNPVMEDVLSSPLQLALAGLKVTAAAKAKREVPVQSAPLPKRTVKRDGKDVQVDDLSVRAEELA